MLRLCALFMLLALCSPEVLAGQASTFEQLQTVIEPGDTISVLDNTGRTSRGQVLELSPSSLRVAVDGAPRDIEQNLTLEIQQRDPLRNGTINGGIAGLGLGVFAAWGVCSVSGQCLGDAVSSILGFTAAGAGIGVLIDAAVFQNRVIYRSPGRSTHWNVTPIIRPHTKGIAISLLF